MCVWCLQIKIGMNLEESLTETTYHVALGKLSAHPYVRQHVTNFNNTAQIKEGCRV